MSHRQTSFLVAVSVGLVLASAASSLADDVATAERRRKAQEFHLRAQERTGILIPFYVYPGDVDSNPA